MKDPSAPASSSRRDVARTSGGLPVRSAALRLAASGDRKRRDSKRDSLLAAARDEFAANGFLGTHIAVVATRVGIRKSTFFHYFDGKEELYDAAVGELLEEVADAVDACATVSPFDERLDAIVECLHRHAEQQPVVARLLLRSLVDGAPAGSPRPTPIDRLAQRVADTVSLGVREGRVPACDSARAALAAIGVVCLQQPSAVTAVDTRGAEPLIGMTSSMRVMDVKGQVRRLLAVR